MCLMRYAGSKAKIAGTIFRKFPDVFSGPLFQSGDPIEYREPFLGSGAMAELALSKLPPTAKVVLSDADPSLIHLWLSVRDNHLALVDRVRGYTPSVEDFYAFKAADGTCEDVLESGFRKLALHFISFSGLGAMAGGPLGGRRQRSEYNVGCRWNDVRITRNILAWNAELSRFGDLAIRNCDFVDTLADAPPYTFIYLDPPYYKMGGALYKYSMDDSDHRRLAGVLGATAAQWALSYDDHPFVRALYSTWADIDSVDAIYTTGPSDGPRRKNTELVITPRNSPNAGRRMTG